MTPSQRLARPSRITSATAIAAPPIAAISTGRKASGSPRPTRPESSAITGATKTATCDDDEIAISAASPALPAARGHDRAAVLGRVPDERDDHRGDEELRQPERARRSSVIEPTSASDTNAVATVATRERRERGAAGSRRCPTARASSDGAVLAQVPRRRRDVEDEQHRRDRQRQEVEAVAVGVAVPARDRRDQEEARRRSPSRRSGGRATTGRPRRRRRRRSRPRGRCSAVPTTEPAIVPRTTFGSPSPIAKSAMISSGAFPKLALRKPPIPSPVCSARCSVASPIRNASGMSAAAASTKSTVPLTWKTYSARSTIGVSANDAQYSRRPTAARLDAGSGLELALLRRKVKS